MDFEKVVKNRFSIRSFKEDKVSDQIIIGLLNLAIRAPSAGNIQSWEFIIIKNRETMEKLAKAALNQKFITQCSHLIVACANQELSSKIYGKRGWDLYSIQDVSAAIMILLLGITNAELGACWVGAFNENEVRKILKIPDGIKPVALIPIGIPTGIEKSGPTRKKLEMKLHFETY